MYKSRNLPNTRIDVADALRGIAVAGKMYGSHAARFLEELQRTINTI